MDRNRGNSQKGNLYDDNMDQYKDAYGKKVQTTANSRLPPKSNIKSEAKYSYDKPTEKKQTYNKPTNQKVTNYDYQLTNEKEEKPIREVNRENHVDIVEYDPRKFVECREGCGRTFNPDSITKHEAICKKVFQKKRKEFNSQDHRLVEREQKKFIKKGEKV